ncbi:hypothetical protein Hanom_Chr03g00187391 [Helianthus anomalus]
MLKPMGYIKIYIMFLRLGYEKPNAFALRASFLDHVAFVHLSLFKTKHTGKQLLHLTRKSKTLNRILCKHNFNPSAHFLCK